MTRSEANKARAIHNHAQRGNWTATYKSWRYMRDRVRRDPNYVGVTICRRWDSFQLFLEDMGECPAGKTLDRIKNHKGYNRDNCKWSTMCEQQNNRTNNTILAFNKRRMTIAEWAVEVGINYKTLFSRVNQYGWSTKKALTTPLRTRHPIFIGRRDPKDM